MHYNAVNIWNLDLYRRSRFRTFLVTAQRLHIQPIAAGLFYPKRNLSGFQQQLLVGIGKGAAARGVHDGGGRIIGVIPEKLNRPGVAYPFCGQLIVTPDMHTRKARMEELSDGFIALPGGYGTLEELMEVLTLNQLGYITAPVVILNTKGYYSDLIAQLRECVNEGFTAAPCLDIFSVAGTPEEAVQLALNKERPDIPDKLADAIRFAAGETGR